MPTRPAPIGRPNPLFSNPNNWYMAWGSERGYGVGDLNGDGLQDVVLVLVARDITEGPKIQTKAVRLVTLLRSGPAVRPTAGIVFQRKSDCLFKWLERTYPALFAPGAVPGSISPYYYRHYSQAGAYLGTSSGDGHVHFLGPVSGGAILDLGRLSSRLVTANCRYSHSAPRFGA